MILVNGALRNCALVSLWLRLTMWYAILPQSEFPQGGPMGKITYGRVILGGFVAGIISFILWFFFNGVLLLQLWVAATKALNPSGHNAASPPTLLVSMFLIGIASEILAIWMYAAIR